jgi:hypothetical protein
MNSLSELRNDELNYCRDHIEYFIDKYGHIEVKKTNADLVQPFNMWEAQKDALRSIQSNRLNIILKARQLGLSWLVCHIAAHLLITRSGRLVIALSRSEEEAKELIRRVSFIFSNMPALIANEREKPNGWQGPTYKVSALELVVKNGTNPVSTMKAFASSPNAGRSFTADLLILDEHAFQEWAEEIWTAAYPTINALDGGKVISLSTIKRGSLFERLYTDPDNGFNKIFIPWYADPERNSEWYENTKKAMGDDITQEYPATVEEALTVPGGQFFPEVNEVNTISDEPLDGYKKTYVSIDYGLDMFSAHWIWINDKGEAQVYREYDAPNLTIGQAAEALLDMCLEPVTLFLAPPDLWNRSQLNGKSRAELWHEAGVNLTKTSRDFPAGCAAMKEWLRPRENKKSKLTLLKGEAPELYRCLKKIQKDEKQVNVYAKKPHDLTHDPDSLRYFCVWWTTNANVPSKRGKKWRADLLEDYDNADSETRQRMVSIYGEPIR